MHTEGCNQVHEYASVNPYTIYDAVSEIHSFRRYRKVQYPHILISTLRSGGSAVRLFLRPTHFVSVSIYAAIEVTIPATYTRDSTLPSALVAHRRRR